MPSVKHNLTVAKAMTLTQLASAQEVLFGMPQYVQCIFHGLINILLLSRLLTAKSDG